MLRFPHQFPIALENAAQSIILREPGKLLPILSPKYGIVYIVQYTLNKSKPPYTTISLLLTISSKNYNSYPKISTKSAATVAFGRKVSEGYSFKKDSQFNSYFSIAMWCCGCSASQTFVFHSLVLSYWIRWHCDIKLPLLSMITLDSSTSTRKKK